MPLQRHPKPYSSHTQQLAQELLAQGLLAQGLLAQESPAQV